MLSTTRAHKAAKTPCRRRNTSLRTLSESRKTSVRVYSAFATKSLASGNSSTWSQTSRHSNSRRKITKKSLLTVGKQPKSTPKTLRDGTSSQQSMMRQAFTTPRDSPKSTSRRRMSSAVQRVSQRTTPSSCFIESSDTTFYRSYSTRDLIPFSTRSHLTSRSIYHSNLHRTTSHMSLVQSQG